MSANNWRICPKCKKDSAKNLLKADKDLRDAYGEVSSEEYMKMVANSKASKKLEETLSEYFEIFTNEAGTFEVSYGCGCAVCGFEFNYQHKQQAL